jgi:hypothetical protein
MAAPTPSPWSTRWDARVPRRFQPLWRTVKWSLAGLGAYLFVGHYVMTWGWATTIWLFVAPFLYAVWRAWPTSAPPSPPSPR